MSKTRIIATVGPASRDPEVLGALIDSGVNVFRVNCSHGTTNQTVELIHTIRSAIERSGHLVAIMADLAGPKIRVGRIGAGVDLVKDEIVTFRAGTTQCDDDAIPVVYDDLPDDVSPGDFMLLDDGQLEVEVVDVNDNDVSAKVSVGGLLLSHKGINLPGTGLKTHAPTARDLQDLEGVLAAGVDYVALSFVRHPSDLVRLREAIRELGHDTPVIAKFERPEAIEHMDEIVANTDGVMVARGDLGIEMAQALVPVLQKRIINSANAQSKPVIVATEMLESMVDCPRPTRAEVSDVANAILDGADALMLSGETAIGSFPISAAHRMGQITELTDQIGLTEGRPDRQITNRDRARALAMAATGMVEELDAAAIVVYTQTGSAARLVSSFRPRVPILALSPSDATLRRLMLIHGIQAAHAPIMDDSDDLLGEANNLALVCGTASPGDLIVAIFGIPGETGGTNRIVVHEVMPAPTTHDHAVHATHRKMGAGLDPYARRIGSK